MLVANVNASPFIMQVKIVHGGPFTLLMEIVFVFLMGFVFMLLMDFVLVMIVDFMLFISYTYL